MSDVSPELFIDGVWAFQVTAALKAAVELDLFTKIGEGATTSAELAHRVGASERGVRILSDFLTIKGFLENQTAPTTSPHRPPRSLTGARRCMPG
jgi:hypothetical protein